MIELYFKLTTEASVGRGRSLPKTLLSVVFFSRTLGGIPSMRTGRRGLLPVLRAYAYHPRVTVDCLA